MSSNWQMLRAALQAILVLFIIMFMLVPLIALLSRWIVCWFRWAGL